ncbi:CARDB domain-containing protein [Thermodesulfobacteriota bacterium]
MQKLRKWLGCLLLIVLTLSSGLLFFIITPVFAEDLEIHEDVSYWTEEQLQLYKRYYYYLDDNGLEVKHGTLQRWKKWGSLSEETVYEHGVEKSSKTWDFAYQYDSPPNYQPSSLVDSQTIDGVRYVTFTSYFSNGCKLKEYSHIDGRRNGTYIHWAFCGQIFEQFEYKDGLLHGWGIQYTDWGEEEIYDLSFETQYKYGKKHGESKNYWGSVSGGSFLKKVETYRDDVLHGPYKEYHENWPYDWAEGLRKEAGLYGNGTKCGSWEHWPLDTTNQTLGPSYFIDRGLCDALDITEPDPYPEITEDDPQVQKEVRGLVKDRDTGSPVGYATVAADGGASTVTDDKGFYSFTLGTGDSYRISVSKDGYYTRSGTINLGSTQYKRLNVKLKKKEARPAITNVVSTYGKFFIEGVPLTNEYIVAVDWNGEAPGVVKFAVNGKVSEIAATGSEVGKTFNMGADFKGGLSYLTNTLQIMAVTQGGIRSAVERLHPVVIPLPAWSTSLGVFGDLKFGENLITYNLKKSWPENPMEIQINPETLGVLWNAWSLIPIVGNRNFGIPPTQVFLDIEAKTDGSGSVASGGTTGFEAAGQEIKGKLGGKGKLQYKTGKGLEWTGASLLMGVEGTIKKEVGPVTLIPALEGAVNLGFGVGRVVRWFNSLAKIEGKINTGYDIELQMMDKDGKVGFKQSEGSISNGIGLGLSMGASKLKTELSGGGTNKAFWQFPANPGYLKKIETELSAKIAMTIWLFSKDFEAKHTFTYPDSTPSSLSDRLPLSVADFQPISRNFLYYGPYNQFVAEPGGSRTPMSLRTPAGQVDGVNKLIENVYPHSEPAIAENNGKLGIAYVYFDPADSTLQGTEIYFSYFDGTNYTDPAPIINDTQAEFAPAIAFDSSANLVCVWERIKDTDFAGTEIGDMAQAMEIVYAVYTPASASWSAPLALTDNAYLDHSPMLKRGNDGGLLLVWRSNPGGDLIGDAASPTNIHYAQWNGTGFSPAITLAAGFEDSFKFSLAYNGTEAVLSYMKEIDGDMATADDEEIFYLTFDGSSWSSPVQLTDDQVADINPQVIYRSDGQLELVWLKDGSLVRLTDINTGAYEIIRPGSNAVTFTDFKVIRDPQNRLVVFWQGLDEKGIDIFYTVYDPLNNVWSSDLRFTEDQDMEKNVAGQFATDGKLHLVYTKDNLAAATDTYTPVDLYHLTYTLSTDLSLAQGDISVEPVLPAPGSDISLMSKVENIGDISLQNVVVQFYLGDPDAGGSLIGDAAVDPVLLKAGEMGTATLAWSLPLDVTTTTVYAVAVPEETVIETDQTNNQAHFEVIKPDLEAIQCKVEMQDDGTVDIIAVIQNISTIPVNNFQILYKAGDMELGVIQIPGLLPTKRAEIAHNVWLDTDFSNWQTEVEVQVDPGNLLDETDEDNNIAGILFSPMATLPDGQNFDHVDVGSSSAAQTFTFNNAVNSEIAIGTLAISGSDAADFLLINDTCSGMILLGGQSCTMDVVFSPTSLGAKTAFLTIPNSDSAEIFAEAPLYGGIKLESGDINGNGTVGLDDALLALQLLSGGNPATVYLDADLNENGNIGMEEVTYILQEIAELR